MRKKQVITMQNTNCNRKQPHEPNGLDQALGDYFAPVGTTAESPDEPSPEFAKRCHAAAWRALEVARMRRERPKIAHIVASLRDHFASLARLAGVRIGEVYAYLTVRETDEFGSESIRGMARLAHLVGMEREETTLRLRVGFALASRTRESQSLADALGPACAHRADAPDAATPSIAPLLSACELGYDAARREQIEQAIAVSASVFADEGQH
jgi:hypothetical protein